ncbi:oligosaccharide flippase family protein [Acinetobacter indicus]|uniref:oligosaccharide flippase family protein n=1 Tax=Acinetobacter indicus TaxID=756892 RepID=UPI001444774D|nr:oligosaccharide flippase family protein [Acinetobacter indicus]
MLKLVSATFVRQILAGLLQLAFITFLARMIGAEGMGVYSLVILLPIILSQILTLGLQSSNILFIGTGKTSIAEVIFVNIFYIILVSIIFTLLGLFFLEYIMEYFFSSIDKLPVLISLLTLSPLLIIAIVPSIFQANQQFNTFNLITLIQPILGLISLLIIELGESSVNYAMIAYSLSSWLTAIIIVSVLIKGNKITFSVKALQLYWSSKSYGLQSHLSNVITLFNYKIALIFLGFFSNALAVGIYTVATQMIEKLWLPSQAASSILFPKLTHAFNEDNNFDASQLTIFVAKIILVITSFFGIIFILLSHWIFVNLFGQDFSKSAFICLILLPGIIAWAPSRVIAHDIAARGYANINLHNSFVILFINLISNLIFIYLFGLLGAAIATSITYFMDLILRLYQFNKLVDFNAFTRLIPNYKDIFILIDFVKDFKRV